MIAGAIGVVIGILLTIGSALLISRTEDESGYLLRKHKVTFGDIQVRINKPSPTFEGQNYWEVWILKDNVPFALLTQNENKKTNGFTIAKDFNERSIAWMEPANSPGKWVNFHYSNMNLKGKRTGMALKDFDFDGDFDFETIIDGNNTSRFIRFNGDWMPIEKYYADKKEAISNGTTYVFTDGNGWSKQ